MARRGLAALSYVPLPGLGYLVAVASGEDRLARFHGLQAGLLTLVALPVLVGVGLASQGASGPAGVAFGVVAILVMATYAATVLRGVFSALGGRYARVAYLWPVLSRLHRPSAAPPGEPSAPGARQS